jgi:hypothetical protein
MASPTIREQLQEQRRALDEQRDQMHRQKHEMDIQFRRIADLQAELDGVKALLLRQAPDLRPTAATASNGNGHARAHGAKHLVGVAKE